jgi:predicted acyl esterase
MTFDAINRRAFLKAAAAAATGTTSLAASTGADAAAGDAAGGDAAAGDAAQSSRQPAWKASLSRPEHEVRTLIDVRTAMRDGIKLSANKFLPTKARCPTPLVHRASGDTPWCDLNLYGDWSR